MRDLWHRSATELAGMIARREVSSREVVQVHLDRIAAINPSVNAVTCTLEESALEAAAAADAATAAGSAGGAFHGVPFSVKENIDLVGSATTWGLPAFAGAVPAEDSPVTARMKAAGGIPIARTNCPDMALRVHTDSSLHGLTRNPWDPGRTTGGSSGGEAVALATGMSPVGLGNDIGGSLRNPASCCGVASIKPSAGRVPSFTHVPAPDGPASFQLMPVEGPLARRVADVRAALRVLEGRDPRDPYSVPTPAPRSTGGRPRRVAVMAEPPGGTTDPAVAGRVRAAADALAAAGYDVVEAAPPRFEDVASTWLTFISQDIRMLSPLIGPLMGESANRFLGYALEAVPAADLGGYTQILMARQGLMREWGMWFTQFDLLLSPTWTQLPFAPGWDAASLDNALATMELIRCVTPANVLGLPSACVPAGLVDGVPVGVLLTADRFDDDTALDAAEAIEAVLGLDTPIDPVNA